VPSPHTMIPAVHASSQKRISRRAGPLSQGRLKHTISVTSPPFLGHRSPLSVVEGVPGGVRSRMDCSGCGPASRSGSPASPSGMPARSAALMAAMAARFPSRRQPEGRPGPRSSQGSGRTFSACFPPPGLDPAFPVRSWLHHSSDEQQGPQRESSGPFPGGYAPNTPRRLRCPLRSS